MTQTLNAFLCSQKWMESQTQSFPPGNKKTTTTKAKPSLAQEQGCQKLRNGWYRVKGSLLFMRIAWPHHEWVMRMPLSPRDQVQSPGIAMKYSIVFTHCNLIPQKRTAKPGFRVHSWAFPSLGGQYPAWADYSRSTKWTRGKRKTNQSSGTATPQKPGCWHVLNLMAERTYHKNNLHSLILYIYIIHWCYFAKDILMVDLYMIYINEAFA